MLLRRDQMLQSRMPPVFAVRFVIGTMPWGDTHTVVIVEQCWVLRVRYISGRRSARRGAFAHQVLRCRTGRGIHRGARQQALANLLTELAVGVLCLCNAVEVVGGNHLTLTIACYDIGFTRPDGSQYAIAGEDTDLKNVCDEGH